MEGTIEGIMNFYIKRYMITQEDIESLGWVRSPLASSHYEPNYFLKGSLKDFPSGIWMTQVRDKFRIVTMSQQYHEVLFMGKIKYLRDLVILMDLLDLKTQ